METINVTLNANTKPRPENQGDIYHNKERVGTFIWENHKIVDLTFFDKEYPLWKLDFIITTPFAGTPTLTIGWSGE